MEKLENLRNVKHIFLVLSGKGGVGKSTFAILLAKLLAAKGKKVGLLDIDLCGPSAQELLGLDNMQIHKCDQGWVPVYIDKDQTLAVMSVAFLLSQKSDAVVWRGPKKNAMIKQFLSDVYWQSLDVLIIDTPPGTSDEHISVVECLRSYHPDGAILVTTPQGASVSDVRREITFCKKTQLPILGVVENMSGYSCPHCSTCTDIFSQGGGRELAEKNDLRFLGKVPIDVSLQGIQTMKKFSPGYKALDEIVDKLLVSLA